MHSNHNIEQLLFSFILFKKIIHFKIHIYAKIHGHIYGHFFGPE